MRGAAGLFRLQILLGAIAAGLIASATVFVFAGTRLAPPSGGAIAGACADWLGSGGPAALVGLAVIAAAALAAFLAGRSVRRQLRAARAYLGELRLGGEGALGRISYREVETDQPVAFCAGYLRPHIYLSRGALDQLSVAERGAVLAHEGHHQRRRDPLRRLLARAAADALFFIPALRRISGRYTALGELAADEAAVADLGNRRPLAAALLKFSEDEPAPAPVAGVDPERVDQLLGAPGAGAWHLERTSIIGSLALLAGLGLLTVLIAERVIAPNLAPALLLATGCMVSMFLAPAVAIAATVVVSRRALALRRS